jgi:hypothetical protein
LQAAPASGWQQVDFPAPIAVTAGTTYVASYHTNTGHYAADNGYFASSGVDNAPLHALEDGVSGGSGVYAYGAGSLFPANSFKSTNYWVDVVFTTAPVNAAYSMWPATSTPTIAADPDPNAVELGVKFRSDVSGLITGIRFYKAATNTGIHLGHLWTATGTLIASAKFVNETASGWQQVNFALPVAIAAGTTYIASYHAEGGHYADDPDYFALTGVDRGPLHGLKDGADGPNGVYAYGATPLFPNHTWRSSNYWVDVVFTRCPCTIWPSTATPAATAADTNAVELGVKFRAGSNGSITGIRFYKATSNTGTHVASLWSASGTLLGRVTFTSETAQGWQQANFATPISIAAGMIYVASYHTDTGHYGADSGYFAIAGVDNGPLHALKDGVSGGNGLYAYGPKSLFPTNTYKSTHYWVDVVFKSP